MAIRSGARQVSDVDLARRCSAGETDAQRALFEREKRRVHATLYRVLGSNAEMDDLVQDAFIEIFRALPSFRGEASLGTWIDRITVRVAYAHISRRKARPAALALVAEPAAEEPGAERRAMSRQAARRLYAVLDRIEARQRIAYVLHVLEDRPIAEVAQVMSATRVLTRVRVWRAKQALHAAAAGDPLLAEYLEGGS